MRPLDSPLFEAFLQIRHSESPLGPDDYADLLRVLDAGFVTSRSELIAVCTALWAKDEADAVRVAEIVTASLPPTFVPPASGLVGPGDDEGRAEADEVASTSPRSSDVEHAMDPVPNTPTVSRVTGRAALLDIEPFVMPRRRFDLRLRPAVPRRTVGQELRRLRTLRRVGGPTEPDVEATIERLHRVGVLAEMIKRPRLSNTVNLVMVEDVGGSMAPFSYVGALLAETAATTGFARFDHLYCHDVPDPAYQDRALSQPVGWIDHLRRVESAMVIIFSDAGAARGRIDRSRIEMSRQAHDHFVSSIGGQVGWLNPVPRRRWATSSAGRLFERGVPMFEFTRLGLRQLVSHLLGASAR